MHDIRVMLAREDVARAAHVRGQLVHLRKGSIYDRATERLVTEIADREIVGLGFSVLVELQIDAADPKTLLLQAPHQMSTYEAAGTADESSFRHYGTPVTRHSNGIPSLITIWIPRHTLTREQYA